MKDNRFLELIESGSWEELESYWLETIESGNYEFDDYLETARLLGRQREKPRAGVLMAFLEEHLRSKERWQLRLRVLKEIVRHTLDLKKLDDVRDQILDTLQRLYPNRPSYATLLRHYAIYDQRTPDALAGAADNIEAWLRFDVGQFFYQPGYGAGRVREVNFKLGVARVDFELKQDITVQIGDSELIPIQQGHILHEKMTAPEEFKKKAEASPSETLGMLLKTFGRAMPVGEIKNCITGGISWEWSRWWTAAKKNPQIIASGKGAQAEYSWSDSASAAEEVLRQEFDAADSWKQIAMAKQYASRGGTLAAHFRVVLLAESRKAYEAGKPDLALEMLELFAKWPGETIDPGFTFDQVLRESDPQKVLGSIDNTILKMKVLAAYLQVLPDSYRTIFSERFLREDNPKALAYIFEQLRENDPPALEALLNRVFSALHAYPAVLVWVSEYGATENLDHVTDPIGRRLDGRFLQEVIEAIDSSEFSSYRNRIKKALESGVLMNALKNTHDPEVAMKIVEKMEHTRYLEDYRRDRWRNFIRARIPETKKKDDFIFSTAEAVERKRAELEQLLKVELPTNRKAIGEAAAHGDLKENHEYKAARERQEYLINRVQVLQADLMRVRLLEPGTSDCSEVRPGTKVHLSQPPDKQMTLTLLGPWDSNPKEHIYSYQAPIGVLLVGRTPGEKIVWNEESWIVDKIEPWS